MRTVCAVVISTLSLIGTAFGQTGGIAGTAVDLAGKPVANAEIQATNAATDAVFKAKTSALGEFALEQVPAGTYRLSSAPPGFNPFSQQGITVGAGNTLRLNLRFEDFQLNTLGDGRDFFAGREADRSKHPVTGPTPRLPDGKPDLSGAWYGQKVVDPGNPKLKPWAVAIKKERDDNHIRDFPQSFCLPLGITMSNIFTGVWRIAHTPTNLVMISEGDTPGHRQIFLDGRGHPKDFGPTWTGHSIGRWEGDALVVDTVGFNDKTWLDTQGTPHTEKLHIVERYRRIDLGRLEIEFRIEDPDTFEEPWIVKRTADLAVNDEVMENVCTENERDRAHLK